MSVYQIENLFWSNENYEFPAHLPTVFVDQQEDLPLRPEMDSYFSGTIRLEGSNGNWCKFEEVYYHLKRVTCLNADPDPKKEVWLYALVRCMGTNTVLTNTIEIKGDLATGNMDGLLSSEINKCSGMVEKPVEIFRTPFIDEDPEKGRGNLVQNAEKFKSISGVPKEKVLTEEAFTSVKEKVRGLKGFKEATKHLYVARKDIYIFGLLEPAIYKDGGKSKVVKRINEAHGKIRYDERRKLVKVTTPQTHNKLLNHYALSYSDSSIGQADNSMILRTLDLSGVTDIVPISGSTLEQKPKETLITEKTAIFDLGNSFSSSTGWDKPGKLARHFYAPLGDPAEGSHYYGGLRGGSIPNGKRNMRNGMTSIKGQKIIFKDFENPEQQKTGFFYWVDRVDFALSGYNEGIIAGGPGARPGVNYSIYQWVFARKEASRRKLEALKSEPVFRYFETFFYLPVGTDKSVVWDHINRLRALSSKCLPGYPIRDADTDYTLWHRMKRLPPYGVLMGQTEREGNEWDRVKYIGKKPIKKLYGYSGIHLDKFKKVYSRTTNGWSFIQGTQLAELCANEYLSKFFLDLDFLLWVYFTPKICCEEGTNGYQYPYFYYDNYELGSFLVGGMDDYDGVKIAAGVKGIINKFNNQTITPPFTDELYPRYSIERTEKIRKVLLRSELELETEIEPGDFFCSDLEYEGRPGNNEIGSTEKNFYEGLKADVLTRSLNLLEDFIYPSAGFLQRGGKKLEKEKTLRDGEGVCICSNLDGGVEIRKISWFKREHTLSKADYQAVKSVDGQTSRTITYGHLKGLGINLETEIGFEIEPRTINKLLGYFYKALGYDVEIEKRGEDFVAKGNGISDEMLTSPEGILLDLVGSDGYAYLRNQEEVHFIYKHPDPTIKGDLTSKDIKRSTLDRTRINERLKNASVTAKINQINILYFYTKPIHIKTKFLFSDIGTKDSPFYVEYKGFNTKDKSVNEDFGFFKAKGEWDEIDEVISIPKEPVNITEVADQLTLEQLRLNQNFERERREHKQQFLGLDQKLVDIRAERAQFDLNTEDINKTVGFALDMAGFVGSMAMRGYGPLVGALTPPPAGDYFQVSYDEEQGLEFEHYTPGFDPFKRRRAAANVVKNAGRFMRRAGLGGTMGIMQGAGNIASYAIGKNRVMPEKARRIQEDKELATKEVALKTLEIDRSHFKAMQDYAMRINYLANQHFKEGFNEAALYEEGKKEKKINSNVYLLTLIPSEKQLKYIDEYREHYGVQCDIPNKVITLKSGMAPNVIRFRNLDEGGILGTNDLVARAGLKARLLSQVKIIDNEKAKEEYSYFDYHVVTPVLVSDVEAARRIEELEEELEKAKNDLTHSHKARDLNLKAFLTKLDKDRDNDEALQKDISDLEALKEKINSEIAKGEAEKENKPDLEKPYEDSDIDLIDKFINAFVDFRKKANDHKNLQQEITLARKQKDDAENERDKAREELNAAHNKERQLLADKEGLQNKVNQLEKEKTEATKQIEQGKTSSEEQEKKLEAALSNLKAKDQEINNLKLTITAHKVEINKVTEALEALEAKNRELARKVCVEDSEIRAQQHGDGKHFMKIFKEIDFDGHKMFERVFGEVRINVAGTIPNPNNGGLTESEMYNYGYTMAFCLDMVLHLRNLEENNYSAPFAADSEKIRNELCLSDRNDIEKNHISFYKGMALITFMKALTKREASEEFSNQFKSIKTKGKHHMFLIGETVDERLNFYKGHGDEGNRNWNVYSDSVGGDVLIPGNGNHGEVFRNFIFQDYRMLHLLKGGYDGADPYYTKQLYNNRNKIGIQTLVHLARDKITDLKTLFKPKGGYFLINKQSKDGLKKQGAAGSHKWDSYFEEIPDNDRYVVHHYRGFFEYFTFLTIMIGRRPGYGELIFKDKEGDFKKALAYGYFVNFYHVKGLAEMFFSGQFPAYYGGFLGDRENDRETLPREYKDLSNIKETFEEIYNILFPNV